MKSPGNNEPAKKHREDLTGEHPFGDIGQLIIALLFLIVWITDSFLKYSTLLNKYIPLAVQITLGAIVLIVALIAARYGMNTIFNEVREKHVVVRKGVFGIVRHPIYLSEILFYLALIIFRTSLVATAIWVIAIIFLYYLSKYEEKLLTERFGEEYRQYMKDVGMFFPKLTRRKEKKTD